MKARCNVTWLRRALRRLMMLDPGYRKAAFLEQKLDRECAEIKAAIAAARPVDRTDELKAAIVAARPVDRTDELKAAIAAAKPVDRTDELKAMISDTVVHANQVADRILSFKPRLDIFQCAAIEHRKVFPKYRNCNVGRDLVLLASGPTLDYYNLHQNALYLGVNKSFYANKAPLDYLFVQDYIPSAQNDIDAYEGHACRKFYGVHYLVPPIAQSHADLAHAERYYFIDCFPAQSWDFPPDISMLPFATYSSVVHPAVVFALYTGARRIFLVGCDTSLGGYSKNLGYADAGKNTLVVDNVVLGWKRLKEYASSLYPDSEIVSVNPVGLRGIFKDVYTAEYLRDHPEIEGAEVLET